MKQQKKFSFLFNLRSVLYFKDYFKDNYIKTGTMLRDVGNENSF